MRARSVGFVILVLGACAPAVEGLEDSFGYPTEPGHAVSASSPAVSAQTIPTGSAAGRLSPQPLPANQPPRSPTVVIPPATETRTDRYGQRITQRRGQQVSETLPGSGVFLDGGGRPVQCIPMGAGVTCR